MAHIHNSEFSGTPIPLGLRSGRNNGYVGAPIPADSKQSEVDEQISLMLNRLNALEDVAGNLLSRLAPVTVGSPIPENNATEPGVYSSLGQSVAGASRRVQTVADALQRQIETLAI